MKQSIDSVIYLQIWFFVSQFWWQVEKTIGFSLSTLTVTGMSIAFFHLFSKISISLQFEWNDI